MKNAIVLCSGGLDSSVAAYLAKNNLGYDKLIILFFDYGQRTVKQERNASRKTAKKLGSRFVEIKLLDISKISASLINTKNTAKKVKRNELKNTKKEASKYYVPCRNIIFLVYALALAESLEIKNKKTWDILTGFKCEGEEAYPDTTEEFVGEMNKLKKTAIKIKGKIISPLIKKDKEDIIVLGKELGVKLEDTYSCYIGTKNKLEHCGTCLSCRLRQEAFYWANEKDKTRYKEIMKDYRKA